MAFFTPLVNAWTWFKKVFVSYSQSAASVAVVITETVKTFLNNPIAGFFENIIDSVTHTEIAATVATTVNAGINKVLTVELAIEGLPDNPTTADIAAYEQRILAAFGVHPDKSKLYTLLAAQVLADLQADLADGKLIFAGVVKTVDDTYQNYLQDLKDTAATDIGIVNAPVGTVLDNGNVVLPDSPADPNLPAA